MKQIKINFYIVRPDKPISPIVAQFYFKGSGFQYYPGISVNPKDWSKNKMRVDHRKSMAWEINDEITKIEKAINRILISFQKNDITIPSSKSMKFAIKAEIERMDNEDPEMKSTEFVADFYNAWIQKKAANRKEYFKRRWDTTIEHALEARPNLIFKDINDDFFLDFTGYLIDEQENINNTINGKVKRIQQLCREALKFGHKVNPHFNDFSFPGERLPAIFLRWSEVEQLENLGGLTDTQKYIRDRFVFRCYTGIRFSDMRHLSKDMILQNGSMKILRFDMVKQGKGNHIFLPEKAYRIWKDNGYDFHSKSHSHQQKENEIIKIILQMAKVNRQVQILRHRGSDTIIETKPICKVASTHTARRTFARAWYERGGDLNKLREHLGHSDLATTLRYVGVEKDETNLEAARLFG